MEEIALKAEKRTELTKGQMKSIRSKGKIPAIVYGNKEQALSLFVEQKQFNKILHTSRGGNVIINLEIDKENPKTVMIKEIQRNPLNDNFFHIDFQEISLKKEIEVTVPIKIYGEAPGVKNGGLLEQILWEIKVRCLPTKIPESIVLDISNLELGKSITAKEVIPPKGVEIVSAPEQVIISVVTPPPQVVEEVAAPAAATAEPEVIGKGKKEKEETEEELEGKKEEKKKEPA